MLNNFLTPRAYKRLLPEDDTRVVYQHIFIRKKKKERRQWNVTSAGGAGWLRPLAARARPCPDECPAPIVSGAARWLVGELRGGPSRRASDFKRSTDQFVVWIGADNLQLLVLLLLLRVLLRLLLLPPILAL